MNSRIDPESIRGGGDWEVYEITPTMRRSRLWMGPDSFIVRTEYLEEEKLLEQNRQSFDESASQRFGDGKVVARIPMNVLYQTHAGRWNDPDFTKWFLNSDAARPYRTFRGKV